MIEGQIRILYMKPEHIIGVVEVHMRSFEGFFLTFLGTAFLRLFYSEMLKYLGSVTIVAVDPTKGNSVIGFAVGVENQSSFYSNLLKKRWIAFALASVPSIVKRPKITLRLIRAITYSTKMKQALTPACFMSMGVLPETAGTGVGVKLATAFLFTMKSRGINAISLTTDRDNNERTNRFHQKTGFKIERTFQTQEGRWMHEYILDLTRWSPPTEVLVDIASLGIEELKGR